MTCTDEELAHHMKLVKKVVRRIGKRLPPHIDRQELIQEGMVGLVQALNRFDDRRGCSFKTYASRRIAGAVFDYLRDWSQYSRMDLSKGFEDKFMLSLSDPFFAGGSDEDMQLVEVIPNTKSHTGLDEVLHAERCRIVRHAVSCLNKREQSVVNLYFADELRQSEIGRALSICEGRVSQLRHAAMKKIRIMLEPALT